MSSWLDIIVRARRSRMGIVWLLAPSIIYVFGMGTFFAAMRPVGSGITMGEHFAHVALGMMVFRVLMSTIIGSRSEEHTSELQSLMRISYAVFCLKKKKKKLNTDILTEAPIRRQGALPILTSYML